jgi:uroporphyrinogen-III synthase
VTAWRLLLTRPAQESAALARALEQDGVLSSSLPLLHIEPLPVTAALREPIAHLDRYALVIVVSKPAARLGLELLNQRVPGARPLWFAVGAGTAHVLKEQGLEVQFPAEGDDSEALLRLPALLSQLDQPAPRVLILRGEGGREWLAEQLRARGATVDYLQLYRRHLPTYVIHTLRQRIEVERLNGVVVSSGQGFANLLQLAADDAPLLLGLPLFVPSARVAAIAAAAGAANVINCAGASALALREALRQCPAPGSATTDKNA